VARLAIPKNIAGLRIPRKFHDLSKKSSPTPPTGSICTGQNYGVKAPFEERKDVDER
jgi:hypothetical protein